MFGLGVTAPCASRSRIRLDIVGWASANLWSGAWRPYWVIEPVVALIITRAIGHRSQAGIRSGPGGWSKGRPKMYLGTMCAPRRAAR